MFQHNKLSSLVLPENTHETHEIQSEAISDNPLPDMTFEGMPTFIQSQARVNLGEEAMAKVTVKGPHAKSLRALLDHHADYVDAFRCCVRVIDTPVIVTGTHQ
ncbi:hypothetical protein [Evansella clarkii]|uniref:hypothetical protein n=1 Tax=Evansella clarkii TaxID=79879 RepID=UPI000B435630|nr:hypothetical protein [Evansella clarkii]